MEGTQWSYFSNMLACPHNAVGLLGILESWANWLLELLGSRCRGNAAITVLEGFLQSCRAKQLLCGRNWHLWNSLGLQKPGIPPSCPVELRDGWPLPENGWLGVFPSFTVESWLIGEKTDQDEEGKMGTTVDSASSVKMVIFFWAGRVNNHGKDLILLSRIATLRETM